jgi:hypothetical protein
MKSTDDIVKLAKELCEKEIARTITLLKDNEDKWNEYMDLKLHDCAVIDTLEIEKNGIEITVNNVYETFFSTFCDVWYQQFLDDCSEEGIDFNKLRDNVGRTSSFYLGILHGDTTYMDVLQDFSCALGESSLQFKYDTNTHNYMIHFEDENNISEAEVEEMLFITKCTYSEIEDALADIITVYNLIDNFKNNQVEIYKEFIEHEVASRLAD